MPKHHVRKTFTLPPDMVSDLGYISRRMKVSQSALLATMAGRPIAQLAALVREVPENPDEEAIRRFRGRSRDLIAEAVQEAMGELGE